MLLPAVLAASPDVVRVEPRAGDRRRDHAGARRGPLRAAWRARAACRASPSTPTRPVSAHSFDTACLAAGGLLALLDAVMAGRLRNGFAFVRPPGHHAERDRAMGFCLFNNVAIGAAYLRARHGLERVLIVDWDVHHGNGTQHIFARDPGVLYVSTHQYPFYPGTGALDEVGARRRRRLHGQPAVPRRLRRRRVPRGLPHRRRADRAAVRAAVRADLGRLRPAPARSARRHGGHRAGFAAHGALAAATSPTQVAGGRCVAVLEGGYDLRAMRDSATAVLDELARSRRRRPAARCRRAAPRPILDAVRTRAARLLGVLTEDAIADARGDASRSATPRRCAALRSRCA